MQMCWKYDDNAASWMIIGMEVKIVNLWLYIGQHGDATRDGLVTSHVASPRHAKCLQMGFNVALHVRHRTPCDVILMPECTCLQLKAVVAHHSFVYFRVSYALFCFAWFVVVPCVLHMRPNKTHCYNKPGDRRYCDLQYKWNSRNPAKLELVVSRGGYEPPTY